MLNVVFFIPWLRFNKQIEESDTYFLSIYAKTFFQEAKVVAKRMFDVVFSVLFQMIFSTCYWRILTYICFEI